MEDPAAAPYRDGTPEKLRQFAEKKMTNQAGFPANVLVAESDYVRSQLLSESVKAAGASSMVAYDGEEAIRLLADHTPDVMLLDLSLTRPSSIELLRAIRRAHGDDMQVVCVTRGGHADLCAAATHLGVTTFVNTPFDPTDLAATLHRLVA
jgi:DNA-binding response OmpR family regulator